MLSCSLTTRGIGTIRNIIIVLLNMRLEITAFLFLMLCSLTAKGIGLIRNIINVFFSFPIWDMPHIIELQQVDVIQGAEIIDKEGEKKVGDVTTVLGPNGLGVIRLEAAQKDASQLVVKDVSNVHVKLHIPQWWPDNWCPEELKGR